MIDVLHISCSVPMDDYGSFGVFYRHYQRLPTDRFRVRPVARADYLANLPPDDFLARIPLPIRLRWWPPMRPWGSTAIVWQRLRFHLLGKVLDRSIQPGRPTVIVTHLWDFYSHFAVHYASRRRLPLITFLHDNPFDWAGTPAARRETAYWSVQAFRHSHRVFSVSKKLLLEMPVTLHERSVVLPPMPSSVVVSRKKPRLPGPGLVHGFAGKRFPGLEPLFRTLAVQLASRGDHLLVVGESDAFLSELSRDFPGTIRVQPKFPKNTDALAFLAAHVDRLVVAYPLPTDSHNTAWASLRSSFPSRLVEYAGLRLPVMIFADSESVLYAWCKERAYAHVALDFSPPAIAGILSHLDTPAVSEEAAHFWETLAATEFSPDTIQATFRNALEEASSPLAS